MARSSTPARIIMPTVVRLRNSQSPMPMTIATAQDDQAIDRIHSDERQRGGADKPGRRLELVGLAAPDGHHEIGERRWRSRSSPGSDAGPGPSMRRKITICSSTPATAMERNPAATPRNQEPVASRRRPADIGAQQIERAMRQVDLAHQPEDEREAARHQEIESAASVIPFRIVWANIFWLSTQQIDDDNRNDDDAPVTTMRPFVALGEPSLHAPALTPRCARAAASSPACGRTRRPSSPPECACGPAGCGCWRRDRRRPG